MILIATKLTREIPLDSFECPAWDSAGPVFINHYWSGERAPKQRHTGVQALWADQGLHFRFDCQQHEPLVVNAESRVDTKSIGLWERDVCEAFLAPDPLAPNRYFEFEAAPTGEWLDLAIEQTAEGRITDWEYRSGMTVTSRVEADRVLIAMRIPWEAFGRVPKPGERWRANFFRCVGEGESRGYLAWQPTLTEKPNFHVPERFGELSFTA
jgi:hypothetical protein